MDRHLNLGFCFVFSIDDSHDGFIFTDFEGYSPSTTLKPDVSSEVSLQAVVVLRNYIHP